MEKRTYVVGDMPIDHDGRRYGPGARVDLTDDEADALPVVVKIYPLRGAPAAADATEESGREAQDGGDIETPVETAGERAPADSPEPATSIAGTQDAPQVDAAQTQTGEATAEAAAPGADDAADNLKSKKRKD